MKRKKCIEKGCRKEAKKGSRCSNCQDKIWRKNNPLKYAFKNWRNNAKRRGIKFEISFEYFCEFAEKTQLLKNRGIYAESWHIDKIIDELGYVEGNLQVLTNSENASKENARRKQILVYDWQTKEGKYQFTEINQQPYKPPEPDSEVPF